MSNNFLKVVQNAASLRADAERKAFDFKIKTGKKQLLRGIMNLTAAVADADPLDFVDKSSHPIPLSEMPAEQRRICETQTGEDGVVYGLPPSLSAKLQYARLGLLAIEAARAEGIAGEDEGGENQKREAFIVNVSAGEAGEGAKLIENHSGDGENERKVNEG